MILVCRVVGEYMYIHMYRVNLLNIQLRALNKMLRLVFGCVCVCFTAVYSIKNSNLHLNTPSYESE